MNTAVWSHSAMNTAARHAQLVLGVTVSIMTNKMPPIIILDRKCPKSDQSWAEIGRIGPYLTPFKTQVWKIGPNFASKINVNNFG